MEKKILAVITVVTLALTACGLPEDGPSPTTPPTTTPPGGTNPGTNTKQVQRPTVDAMANTTCAVSIPLQGKAPVNASVLVTGGTSDIATDPNGITGRFCVDVNLKLNTLSTLKVYAHDPDLGLSQPTTITITQSKCSDDVTKPETEQPKSKNVALGTKVTSNINPASGNAALVTDGQTSGAATYNDGAAWFDAKIWVKVTLDKLVEAQKIVVKWRDSKGDSTQDYGQKYKVLVATGNPTDPNLDDMIWTQIGEITAGDGGIDLFDLKTKQPLVQHVALWLEQDDNSWSWSESFAITEIEIWDTPKKSTSTPQANTKTCATVGTSN